MFEDIYICNWNQLIGLLFASLKIIKNVFMSPNKLNKTINTIHIKADKQGCFNCCHIITHLLAGLMKHFLPCRPTHGRNPISTAQTFHSLLTSQTIRFL